MITGCGTLFPATSIPSSTFWRTDLAGCYLDLAHLGSLS